MTPAHLLFRPQWTTTKRMHPLRTRPTKTSDWFVQIVHLTGFGLSPADC